MATVLPPPSKRQRTEAAERSRAQQDIEEVPSDAGSLRLQFYDETTGLPIGQGPVLVPVADATPKNLELLLNTLQGHVSFHSLERMAKVYWRLIIYQRTHRNIFHTDSHYQSQVKRAPTLSRLLSRQIYGRR